MEKAKVYFMKEITPENLIRIYEVLGKKLEGKVAVKMHSGEKGNQNYLRPEFVKDLVQHVGGTVVECNTAYEGARNSTEKHRELIKEHGWNQYFPFDSRRFFSARTGALSVFSAATQLKSPD